MFNLSTTRFGFMAVCATGWLAMRAVTLSAFHPGMDLGFRLFFDDLKAVSAFVTLGAQLLHIFHRFILLQGLVPESNIGVVGVGVRNVANLAADIPPLLK